MPDQVKQHFDASNKAHLIEARGAKFITYVGLQMRLLDQKKWIKSTDTIVLEYPWDNPRTS